MWIHQLSSWLLLASCHIPQHCLAVPRATAQLGYHELHFPQVAGSDQSSGNHLILLQDPRKITTFAKTTTGRHGMKKVMLQKQWCSTISNQAFQKLGLSKKHTTDQKISSSILLTLCCFCRLLVDWEAHGQCQFRGQNPSPMFRWPQNVSCMAQVGICLFTPLHILRKAGFWDRSKRHPASWDGSLPISFLHIDMYAARYSRCIGVRRYAQSTEHRFQLVFHSSPVLSIQKFWWWSCKNRCHSQGSDLRRQWITYVLVNGSKISQHGWLASPDENGEESWATNETPSKVCRAGRHMDDDIGMAKCSV